MKRLSRLNYELIQQLFVNNRYSIDKCINKYWGFSFAINGDAFIPNLPLNLTLYFV